METNLGTKPVSEQHAFDLAAAEKSARPMLKKIKPVEPERLAG